MLIHLMNFDTCEVPLSEVLDRFTIGLWWPAAYESINDALGVLTTEYVYILVHEATQLTGVPTI